MPDISKARRELGVTIDVTLGDSIWRTSSRATLKAEDVLQDRLGRQAKH